MNFVNSVYNIVYEYVIFFEGQVYDWGRLQNTGPQTRTKITPQSYPPPPPPRGKCIYYYVALSFYLYLYTAAPSFEYYYVQLHCQCKGKRKIIGDKKCNSET